MAEEQNENCLPPEEPPCPGPPTPRPPTPRPPVPRPPEEFEYGQDYLNSMRRLAGREVRDVELYNFLISQAEARVMAEEAVTAQQVITDGSVLRDLRDREVTNGRILGEIYEDITGNRIVPIRTPFTPPATYDSGLERALFNEMEDMTLYRSLYLQTRDPRVRDRLFTPLTNEIYKGNKLNFLYARRRR